MTECRGKILLGSVKIAKYFDKLPDEARFFRKWDTFFRVNVLPMIKDLDDSSKSALELANRIRIFLKYNFKLSYGLNEYTWTEIFSNSNRRCNCVCGTMLFLTIMECVGFFPKYVYAKATKDHIWIETYEPRQVIETTDLSCDFEKRKGDSRPYNLVLLEKLITSDDVLFGYFNIFLEHMGITNPIEIYKNWLKAPGIIGIKPTFNYNVQAIIYYNLIKKINPLERITKSMDIIKLPTISYSSLMGINSSLEQIYFEITENDPLDKISEFLLNIIEWLRSNVHSIKEMEDFIYVYQILTSIRKLSRIDCLQYVYNSKDMSVEKLLLSDENQKLILDRLYMSEYMTDYEIKNIYGYDKEGVNSKYNTYSEKIGKIMVERLPWKPNRWEYVLTDPPLGMFVSLDKKHELLRILKSSPDTDKNTIDMISLLKERLDETSLSKIKDLRATESYFDEVEEVTISQKEDAYLYAYSCRDIEEIYEEIYGKLKFVENNLKYIKDLLYYVFEGYGSVEILRKRLIEKDKSAIRKLSNCLLTIIKEVNKEIKTIPIKTMWELFSLAYMIRCLSRIDCLQYFYNSQDMSMFNIIENRDNYSNIISLCAKRSYLTTGEYKLAFRQKVDIPAQINCVDMKYHDFSIELGELMIKELPWVPRFWKYNSLLIPKESNIEKLNKCKNLKEKLNMELHETENIDNRKEIQMMLYLLEIDIEEYSK